MMRPRSGNSGGASAQRLDQRLARRGELAALRERAAVEEQQPSRSASAA